MSYINRNLLSNEDVMFRGHLSRVIFISPSLIVLLGLAVLALDGDIASIGVILLAAGLAGFLSAFVRYQTSEFAVTNKRVIMKVGLIRRTSVEIVLNKIESIKVDQGIAGRIFDYGSIAIVGTGGTHDPFHRIAAPLQFRRAVQEQLAG
ncbi:PH domain-containing protein [Thiomonas sp. FB-Cd]|uniref:PH domain-containing protein n=1 Tax=Thiomonas sp. FB-Cd TaxID=1158292 RepID=UPI0004DF2AC7|nr:PH domain-containing protein [Thiomonas sp. FB-Cd]